MFPQYLAALPTTAGLANRLQRHFRRSAARHLRRKNCEENRVCRARIHCFVGSRKYKSHCPIRSSATSSRSQQQRRRILDQQMALLRKDIRTIEKQLIARNLTLTDGQATKFWPVYEQYSAEFGKINETRSAVIKEYADGYGQLTDEQADNLIRRWLDTDIAAAQLRQKYVAIFRKVLPGKQAATFLQ